jgi:hypothetical protein
MTSMARILGRSPGMAAIESLTLAAFAEIFHSALREEAPAALEPLR